MRRRMGVARRGSGRPRDGARPEAEGSPRLTRVRLRTKRLSEASEPVVPRKTARKVHRAPVPQTDTGGWVEHTEAIGSTMVKELGTMAP